MRFHVRRIGTLDDTEFLVVPKIAKRVGIVAGGSKGRDRREVRRKVEGDGAGFAGAVEEHLRAGESELDKQSSVAEKRPKLYSLATAWFPASAPAQISISPSFPTLLAGWPKESWLIAITSPFVNNALFESSTLRTSHPKTSGDLATAHMVKWDFSSVNDKLDEGTPTASISKSFQPLVGPAKSAPWFGKLARRSQTPKIGIFQHG